MPDQNQARREWMSILAKSSVENLEQVWADLPTQPGFSHLRKPETGLIMVRGRAGGVGRKFNLGEMIVTRCVVALEDGPTGFGYTAGRDHRRAELAAVLDAMFQDPRAGEPLRQRVLGPLREHLAQEREERSRRSAATKVDFFTMVRGDD